MSAGGALFTVRGGSNLIDLMLIINFELRLKARMACDDVVVNIVNSEHGILRNPGQPLIKMLFHLLGFPN